jgi:hypothetical protein
MAREDGSVATNHHEKAELLWNSFKNRLGVLVPLVHTINLSMYFNPVDGLENMYAHFTHADIDEVVAHLYYYY